MDKYYKDLPILGKFTVSVGQGRSFMMRGYGGSIENETFWKGLFNSWEGDMGWIFLFLAEKASCIFDIGASTGIYSLSSKTVSINSEVYAFEPSNNTYGKLVHNNELNGSKFKTFKIALSNKNGNATFYDVPDEHQTSASLSDMKLKNWSGYDGHIIEYDVEVNTFDSFIERNNIKSVDLIKIDVEMHEPEVIQGMQKSIEYFKPYIFVEVLYDHIGERIEKYFDENWVFFHLKDKNTLLKSDKLARVDYQWNYLLVHKDRIEPIKQFIVS